MKRRILQGFTLIELLVSMSIVVLLVAMLSQVVGLTGASWLSNAGRVDAFTQGRATLSALDRDVKRMILRPDLAAFSDSTGTASALAFYTRAQGGSGNRTMSLVQYQVQNPITQPRLVRNDYGLVFDGTNGAIAPRYGEIAKLPDLTNSNVETRELAAGVVCLNWKFIDGNGVEKNQFIYDYANPGAITNTPVVRVSMLVLDSASYAYLIKTGRLSDLLAQTNESSRSSGSVQSIGQYWESLISSSALSNKVPGAILKSLRVFERSFNLPVSR